MVGGCMVLLALTASSMLSTSELYRYPLRDNSVNRIQSLGSCPASVGFSDTFLVRVGGGLILDSALNLTEVFWAGPECTHVYVGSPAIVRASNGDLLASHDFFGDTTMNDTVQVAASTDNGLTWRLRSNISGIYWANMFVSDGITYMLGTAGDDIPKISPPNKIPMKGGPVVIASSKNAGISWSTPTVILQGSFQTAPTPIVTVNGTLFRSMEDSSVPDAPGAFIMWASSSSDLMNPENWHRSNSLSAPIQQSGHSINWQEGSAIEGPDGRIVNLLRINGQRKGFSNVAGLTYLDKEQLVFDRYVNGPFSTSKFLVRRDPTVATATYYALSTNTTDAAAAAGNYGARNNLVLSTSSDLINWSICATVAADDSGLAFLDSNKYTGFEYPDFQFDQSDIIATIRTSYRGAASDGSSNRLTFKRIANYRSQCAV